MSFVSLIDDERLIAPLCLDALSARVAEKAGFRLGYLPGGALGYGDAVSEALHSTDELCDVVRHVTARSNLPIIVDAGVGFGDAAHVTLAINQFIAAGAAMILLMPDSAEQYLQLETRIPAPIVTFGALGARTSAEWPELGISLVLNLFTPQVLAIGAIQLAYRNYLQNGSTGHSHKYIFAVYNQLGKITRFDNLYAIEDATTEKQS